MNAIRELARQLRAEVFDKHYLRAASLWATAFLAGTYIQSGLDHHGWEWAGWTSYGVSLILMLWVTGRLRKAKCSKLHAEIVQEQRSKAMWS